MGPGHPSPWQRTEHTDPTGACAPCSQRPRGKRPHCPPPDEPRTRRSPSTQRSIARPQEGPSTHMRGYVEEPRKHDAEGEKLDTRTQSHAVSRSGDKTRPEQAHPQRRQVDGGCRVGAGSGGRRSAVSVCRGQSFCWRRGQSFGNRWWGCCLTA